MEAYDTPPSSLALLGEALLHPLRKWAWWLVVASLGIALFWLIHVLSQGRGRQSDRGWYVVAILVAVVVRCYYSAVENSITGYGERLGEGGPRMDEFWETLLRVLGAAAISWCPMGIAAVYLHIQGLSYEPWVTILGTLGCFYFPMAVLGIINFGGLHGAMPHIVIPAILRSGPFFIFASLGLLLVPYSGLTIFQAFYDERFWGSVAASIIASYFLVAHARLNGRIYVANRERLGWE